MIDKEGTVLRNLEDQVQYLTDLNEWASLGFTIAGKMVTADTLPAADTLANGTTYIIGVKAPYHFWAAVNGGWVDLGEFPRKGDPGIKGEKGDSIVGPKGDKGDPSSVPGPAGKNGGGLGVENITDINLATGAQSVTYDSTNGATVTAQGKIVAAGQDYPVTVSDKIPLVAGENVTIATENNKMKINAKQAVKSVNGKVGNVELTIPTSTSQLVNDAEFITASYHDNTKQNTLVSGDNIKTINNESILGPGNINISGGGGGGTDTGFGNVRRIEYVDHSIGYYPDTQEYLVSSGTMGVYLNGSQDPINIETVQSFGIMPGNNITFTEEQVGEEWKLKINATGGGGGGSGETYEVIDVSSITTLTDEQYNKLISSPFNKVKNGDSIYDLVQETSTQLIYTAPYLNFIYVIVISKSNKKISASTAKCLTNISSYVKNSLDYDVNNSTYALSAYQGKLLNDRLTTVENTGAGVTKLMNQDGTNESTGTIFVGAGLKIENNILKATGGSGGSNTLYQHHITLSVPAVYTSTNFDDPSGEATIEFSFYSPHAPFTDYEELFNWMNSAMNRWIDGCNGVAYDSNFSVNGEFSRIRTGSTLSSSSSVSYYELSKWEPSAGWTPVYYIKEKGLMDSHSLTDSAGEM